MELIGWVGCEGCGFTVLGIRLLTGRQIPWGRCSGNYWLPLSNTETNLCSPRPRSTRRGWTSGNWKGRWASGTSRTRVTMRAGSSLWQSTHSPDRGCQPTGCFVGPSHPRTTRCRGWPSASVSSEVSGSHSGLPRDAVLACSESGASHFTSDELF